MESGREEEREEIPKAEAINPNTKKGH